MLKNLCEFLDAIEDEAWDMAQFTVWNKKMIFALLF